MIILLVGISVYYDLTNVDSYMWLPDEKLDKKLGGTTFVLVGYITERNMFIAATTWQTLRNKRICFNSF